MSSGPLEAAKAKAQSFQSNSDDPSTWEYIKSDRLRSALQEAAGYEPPAMSQEQERDAAVRGLSVDMSQLGRRESPEEVNVPVAMPQAQAPAVGEPTPAAVFNPGNALYYGDSIATGLGHGGARGTEGSDAMWGRGAAQTLATLNSRPEGTFRGRDIVLSSGVLNSGADWDTVRSQIRLLQGRGANSIRLVGAPQNSERFSGYNEQLQSIADQMGITFLGGYQPGADGVHFDYSTSPVYRAPN